MFHPSPPPPLARSLAFLGSPGGRGKLSRLQPEPAAATWVGREGTGAGKAGPGEGGGAGSWELGSRGAHGWTGLGGKIDPGQDSGLYGRRGNDPECSPAPSRPEKPPPNLQKLATCLLV